MKNLFSVFGNQTAPSTEQPAAFDLNEQDLEMVNGACGHDYCDNDDYDCDDDWDYDHSCEWNHRHHRHHRHHHHC